MSEYAYGLRTSIDGRATKCCMCANSIKKGKPYVLTIVKARKIFNYCQWCWNDWACMDDLPSWDELVNKKENK
jgi:hypothetical protein